MRLHETSNRVVLTDVTFVVAKPFRLAELQATQQQLTDKVAELEQAQQLALQRQQDLQVLGAERAELARRLDWIESSRVWRIWSWIASRLLHLRNGPP